MTTFVFLLKRFVAQRLLGLAIVVTLAFTIGVLVAGPIYADAAREAILGAEVATANVTVRNARLTQYGDPAFPHADADAQVEDALASVPLDSLVRQGRGTVRLVSGEDAEPVSITTMFRTGAFDNVPLQGAAPVGSDEVALPSSVAGPLGIRVGDEVSLLGPTGDERTFTVVGIFDRPGNTESDYWYGTQTPFPSETRQPGQLGVAEQIPPALMSQEGYLAAIPQLGVTTEYVWDAYVGYEGMPFEQAQRLPRAITAADLALREDATFAGIQTTTGIATMIELVRQRVADLRVPILLVVFQIAAVTLAVLAGVGALVLSRQSFELAVLRSRGFSRGKLLAGQAVQAVFAAVVAFPLGLILGAALAVLASNSNGPSLPGVLFPIAISPTAQALGIVGAAAGALALLLLSLPHVRRTILEERRLLSREDRPLLARVPVELFVLPVALFSFLQLRNTEVQSNVARANLDPLVLLTPTLLIFGLSFLSLRILLFVLHRLDRPVGRTRRLGLYLAARRLGRSPGTSFATSLLLVLAVGLLVVSTSYRAIVLGNHEDSAHQQVGSDWNVQVAVPEHPLAAIAAAPRNATSVIRTEPSFERTGNFSLIPAVLAVDPSTFEDGGWWRDDYSPVPQAEWLPKLETPDPAIPIDGGTFSADIVGDEAARGLDILVTYSTDEGEVLTASAGRVHEEPTTHTVELTGASRLMSIAFAERSVGDVEGEAVVTLSDTMVGTTPIPLQEWQPLTWRGSGGQLTGDPSTATVAITPGAGTVVGGIAPPAPPLPALVSPEVARSQGQDFNATIGGQRLAFHGEAIAEHFPSVAGDFVVVSTPALLRAASRIPEPGLALNEVWVRGTADPRPALERAGFITGTTRAAGPIVAALAQLPQSLAVGMNYAAAAGGLGLVVLGVGVGLYFAQRRRAFEFASLRAMGAEPSQISRTLLLEQGTLVAFAILVGAGLGYGVLRLVMPYIARSIGSAFPEPTLSVDWSSLAIAFTAIVAATTIGLFAALRALVRSSVTSVLRGEAE